MVDIEAGLKYPIRGDGTLKLHAIGGGVPALLNLFVLVLAIAAIFLPVLWVLFVVLLPVQVALGVVWTGYFVGVARDTFEGGTEPPAFGDWGGLARDGFWGFLVVLAYQIPTVVLTVGGYALAFAFIFGASFGVESGAEGAAATAGIVGMLVLLFVFLLAMVYSLLAAYLLPISLVAYADEGRLGAAFSIDTLRTVGRSAEYVKPWVASVGVYVVVATAVSILTALLVGYLLVPLLPFAYFFVGTAAFHMFAQSYAATTGTTIPSTGSVDETTGSNPVADVGKRPPEDV